MVCSTLLVAVCALGAAGDPASSLRGSSQPANLTDDYCRGATITTELWTQVCKHQVCHNDIAESDPGDGDHSGSCWHCWCNGAGVQEGRQPIGDDYKEKVFNEFGCCPVNDGKPDPCGGWKLREPSWTEPQCP